MPNIHRICREMGIKLHPRTHPHVNPLPAKHTWARKAIYNTVIAGERAGLDDHVYNVLCLFSRSENNCNQLYGDAISGVSQWAVSQRIKSDEIPFLQAGFDKVDIAAIRAATQHYNIPRRSTQIALMVAGEMEHSLSEIRTVDLDS